MPRGRCPHDDGLATVWAAGAVAALLVIAGVMWTLGAIVVTRHHASNAADLAALAAAGHLLRGPDQACERATRITEGMRVRLRECRFDGWDALVVVEAAGPTFVMRFGPITAQARAGPVERWPNDPRSL